MRLIKAQNTNQRSIYAKGVKYDVDEQVIVDSSRALVVPIGVESDRPGEIGVITGATNGQLRYNTTTDELEAYQDGAWRNLRFKEPNRNPGIIWQPLGVGDLTATETVFGELDSQDPNTDYTVPIASEHILVLIENVIQIPVTNYNIRQTAEVNLTGPNAPYTSTGSGWWIEFTEAVPTGKPVTVIHNLDK